MRLLSALVLSLILPFALHEHVGAQTADFGSTISYEIGGTAYNVDAADLDGDTDPDIVASSHAGDGIFVLLNNGDGAFGEAFDRFVTNAARGLAVGDFDNDGHVDVVVAANIQELYMLPGLGDGTFGEPRISEEQTFSGTAFELAEADFDGDGNLDVAALGAQRLLVFRGDGEGGFTRVAVIISAESFVTKAGLVSGDLNGDGSVDLAVATGDGEIVIVRNDGTGNLSESARITTSSEAIDIAAGDFDGDGDVDLAASGMISTTILINHDNDAFEAETTVPASSIAWNVEVADVNLDGHLDLVQVAASHGIQVSYGDGDGGFETGEVLDMDLSTTFGVAARDVNTDGRVDLVATDAEVIEGRLAVRLNSTVPQTPALAVDDSYSVDEGHRLEVAAPGVLENDAGTPPLAASMLTNPSNGEINLNADGSFTYIPAADFNGRDSFAYRLIDGDGQQDEAEAFITVHAIDEPVAELLLLRAGVVEPGLEEHVSRRRRGVANLEHLAEIAAGAGGEILLNFFEDVEVLARQTDAVWRSESAFTWYGRFPESEQDHVLIVVDLELETVTGNATVNGRLYQIRPVEEGMHETREIDQAAFPEGEDFTPPVDNGAGKAGSGAAVRSPMTGNADAHPFIDLLVVYTSNVASFSSDVSAEIQLAIDETNLGFSQSGVHAEVRLVGAEQVVDGEALELMTNRDRLQDPSDGFMDEVHDLRQDVGADVVGLIVQFGFGCGIAYIMEEVDVDFRDWAFFVVKRSCATGNYSFGHELGHLMGARHDRFVDDTDGKPFDYNHGYVHVQDGWRTVMAYNDDCDCSDEDGTEPDTCPAGSDRTTAASPWCDRLLYWSDPGATYDKAGNNQEGGAMGIASGDEAADNVRALNNSAPTVAAFMDVDVRHISGFVRHRDSGAGIEGVEMIGFPVTTLTDSDGYYEAFVTDGWSSVVTPIYNVYTFDPPEVTFTDVASDLQEDFTAIPPHLIAGKITELQTNDPTPGVLLLGFPVESGTIQTNADGEYEGEVPVGWSGRIRPTAEGLHLSPELREYEDVAADQIDQDYFVTAVVLADSDWPLFGRNPARTASGFGSPIRPSLRWSVELNNEAFYSSVVGPNGTVYVVSTTGRLHAFEPDGTELWSTAATNFDVSAAPAIGAGGVVYLVQSSSGSSPQSRVVAVEPDGSGLKWSTSFIDNITTAPNLGESGAIYFGTDGGDLVALNVQDGSERWRFQTGAPVMSSPALGDEETIYFGSTDGLVYALSPEGIEKWRISTVIGIESSPAVGSDGTIYVGSNSGLLWAINPDGSMKWVFVTRSQIHSSPGIGPNGEVFVGSDDGYLYAVGSGGDELWRFKTQGRIRSSPAVTTHRSSLDALFPGAEQTETVVYVGSDDGFIYAVNAGGNFSLSTAGTKRWSYDTGSSVDQAPSLSFGDNSLYVGSGNTLNALGEESEGGTGLIQFTSLGTTIDADLLELKDNIHIIVTFEGVNGFGEGAILGGLPDDPCQGGPLFIPDCEDLLSGFGSVSPLVDIPAGEMLRIGIAEEGTGPAILDGDLAGLIGTYSMALQPGETYKGILAGSSHPDLMSPNPDGRSTSLTVFSTPTEQPIGNGIPVYAGHLSTDMGAVQISFRGGTEHTFEALQYGEFSDPTLLPAGEYVAEVVLLDQTPGKASGEEHRIFFPISLTDASDGLFGFLLAGFMDPDANLGGPGLSVYQPTDAGAAAIPALNQKQAARELVARLLESVPDSRGRKNPREMLEEARDHIDASLDEALWVDDRHLHPEDGEAVFDEGKDAVRELTTFMDADAEWRSQALLAILHLVVADQVLAGVATEEASENCVSSDCRKELEQARDTFSEAKRLLSDGQYEACVPYFAESWEAAQEALNEAGRLQSAEATPSATPTTFSLDRNYPNPFNPLTTIGYSLPVEIDVRVEVFDPLGRRVALLVDETQPAGRHEITFNSGRLASGIYLYRVTAGSFVETRTMALLK